MQWTRLGGPGEPLGMGDSAPDGVVVELEADGEDGVRPDVGFELLHAANASITTRAAPLTRTR